MELVIGSNFECKAHISVKGLVEVDMDARAIFKSSVVWTAPGPVDKPRLSFEHRRESAGHAAVMAEVDVVLAWANTEFGERKGPVEDGHVWDQELLIQHEADGRITVTLTFSATPEFADAFLAIFAG